MEVKEIITERIEQLSKKNKHYVINLGDIEKLNAETKGIKIYHLAGKEDWCVTCGKIKELKRLLKILSYS